jgi:hypothetical protein
MRTLFIVVALTAALVDGTAFAQGDDVRAVEARKACASGDVDKGIKLLAEILATTDDVTAVYNMGRCYQQNGKPDKAALQFREYLRKATDLSPELRSRVQAQLREAEADERASRRDVSTSPLAGSPPPGSTLAGTPSGTADRGASSTKKNLRLAGIGVASAGVVSIGTAVYFGLRAKSLADHNEKAGNTFSKSDEDAGKTANTVQYVFYGIGAAALASGAVLYYLGWDHGEQVAVLPSVTPHRAGAVQRIRL